MARISFLGTAILLLLLSCNSSRSQSQQMPPNFNECEQWFKVYSHYWTNDSLGKNGFREIFADRILRGCNFVGTKWDKISGFLGKPNFSFKEDQQLHYRYRLNNYTDYLAAPGNMFLEIYIKDEIIIIFKVETIDG